MYLSEAGNFLWIILTASVTSTFTSLLFLKWSSPQIVNDIIVILGEISFSLETSMKTKVADPELVCSQLLKKSIALAPTYRRSAFEPGFGHLSGASFQKPVFIRSTQIFQCFSQVHQAFRRHHRGTCSQCLSTDDLWPLRDFVGTCHGDLCILVVPVMGVTIGLLLQLSLSWVMRRLMQ
jgi:hypothetical protein